jgi:hypothetical protein
MHLCPDILKLILCKINNLLTVTGTYWFIHEFILMSSFLILLYILYIVYYLHPTSKTRLFMVGIILYDLTTE